MNCLIIIITLFLLYCLKNIFKNSSEKFNNSSNYHAIKKDIISDIILPYNGTVQQSFTDDVMIENEGVVVKKISRDNMGYAISDLQYVLNENNLSDIYHDYYIYPDNLLTTIKRTYFIDNIKNGITSIKPDLIIKAFLIVFNENIINLCNTSNLLKYCKKQDTYHDYYIYRFKKDTILFKLSDFGDEYLETLYNYIYPEGSYNEKSTNDFVDLLKKFMIDFKTIINKIINTPNEDKAIIPLHKEFKFKKGLYYKLRDRVHLFNKSLLFKNKEQSDDALKCCSITNFPDKCYNFNKTNKYSPIIYGDENYGYIKESKCVNPDIQKNITIIDKMKKISSYNVLTYNERLHFIRHMNMYFKVMHGVIIDINKDDLFTVTNKLIDVKASILSYIKRLVLKKPTKLKSIVEFTDKNIINNIKIINTGSSSEVFEILKNEIIITVNHFNIISLNNDKLRDYRRNFTVLYKIGVILNYFKKSDILLIGELISLSEHNKTYNDLLHFIPIKFRNIIFHKLMDIIKTMLHISVIDDKYTINSKPNSIILISEYTFPSGINEFEYIRDALLNLRKRKLITLEQYNKIKNITKK
jgi:hypothetical protein